MVAKRMMATIHPIKLVKGRIEVLNKIEQVIPTAFVEDLGLVDEETLDAVLTKLKATGNHCNGYV